MLSPGHKAPALVKSCERYRVDHLWSISPDAYTQASPPEGRTSVQRFRTREGQGGLTAFLQDVGTELAGSCSGFAGVAESNLAGVAGLGPRLIGCQTNASRFYSPHQNNQVQGQSRSSSTNPATTGFRPTYATTSTKSCSSRHTRSHMPGCHTGPKCPASRASFELHDFQRC